MVSRHPPTSTRSNRSPAPQSHPSPCTPKILLAPYKIPSVNAPNPGPEKNTCDMTHSVDGRNPALGMYRTLWILEQIYLATAAGFPSRIKSTNYTMDMICIDCSVTWDGSPCPPTNPHETELLQAKHHFNTAIFWKTNIFPCSSPNWIHWNVPSLDWNMFLFLLIIKAQHPSHPLKTTQVRQPLSAQSVAQLFLHQGLQLWHLFFSQTSMAPALPQEIEGLIKG